MNKYFVPHKESLELKELGFIEIVKEQTKNLKKEK